MQQESSVYQAPQSDVSTALTVQKPKVFAISGRIGRLRYMAYSFGILLVLAAAMLPFIFLAQQNTSLIFGAYIPGAAMFAYSIILMIRRLNDMNWSGWLCILSFIPVINLILYLLLIFKPGSKATNNYGAMPSENSTIVVIAGLFLPLIAFGGIVAGIAIPAYQQYVQAAGV